MFRAIRQLWRDVRCFGQEVSVQDGVRGKTLTGWARAAIEPHDKKPNNPPPATSTPHPQDLAALERETRALKAQVDAFRAEAATRRAGVEALVLREVRAAADAVATTGAAADEAATAAAQAAEEAGKAAEAGVDALAARRAFDELEKEAERRRGGGDGAAPS